MKQGEREGRRGRRRREKEEGRGKKGREKERKEGEARGIKGGGDVERGITR